MVGSTSRDLGPKSRSQQAAGGEAVRPGRGISFAPGDKVGETVGQRQVCACLQGKTLRTTRSPDEEGTVGKMGWNFKASAVRRKNSLYDAHISTVKSL